MEVEEALIELLGEGRSGDRRHDLVEAAKEAMRRRRVNSERGGAVINALHAEGMSWREIEAATGIASTTARRWAEPPA